MVSTCRELLRAWRRDPTDPVAADACAAALHRARVELPWELIPALSRWRQPLGLVARFAAQPPAEADGWPEAELLAAEARLGFRLPVALREWYRVVGRWTGAPLLHGWMVTPAELVLLDGLLVVLRNVDARASIREADLGRVDPLLFVENERRSEAGELEGPLSRTLGGRLLLELARDGPWDREVRSGTLGVHSGCFHKAGLPLLPGGGRLEQHWTDSLHGDVDLLVVGTAGLQVHIRARTAEAWERAVALAEAE